MSIARFSFQSAVLIIVFGFHCSYLSAQWLAGCEILENDIVRMGGIDSCFSATSVSDSIWDRMQGVSYKKNDRIGRADLRYLRLLHYGFDGKIYMGEMIANVKIAQEVVVIFRQLYDARYMIERMRLPDVYGADDERQMQANNTSCFCYRTVAGSATLSKHALGMAIDINPLYNPYVRTATNGRQTIQPTTAKTYADRNRQFSHKIDRNDLAYKLFTAHGFTWGGNWRRVKDYQHFEK